MTSYTIRPALTSDSEAILALMIDGIKEWAGPVLDKVKPWMEEVCRLDYVQNRHRDENYRVFVAEQNSKVIGTIYLHASSTERAYFGGWYCIVKNQGVGSELLKNLLSYAKSQGLKSMDCDVYEENKASIQLVEKYGAVQTGSLIYDDVNYLIYTFTL